MTTFTVGDPYEIKGRGPCITRSLAETKAARAAGEAFELGEVITTEGGLVATIVGIEHMGVTYPQCGLLLRGVTMDQLHPGQVWRGKAVCPQQE